MFLIGKGERAKGLEITALDFVKELDRFRLIGDKELAGLIFESERIGNWFNALGNCCRLNVPSWRTLLMLLERPWDIGDNEDNVGAIWTFCILCRLIGLWIFGAINWFTYVVLLWVMPWILLIVLGMMTLYNNAYYWIAYIAWLKVTTFLYLKNSLIFLGIPSCFVFLSILSIIVAIISASVFSLILEIEDCNKLEFIHTFTISS